MFNFQNSITSVCFCFHAHRINTVLKIEHNSKTTLFLRNQISRVLLNKEWYKRSVFVCWEEQLWLVARVCFCFWSNQSCSSLQTNTDRLYLSLFNSTLAALCLLRDGTVAFWRITQHSRKFTLIVLHSYFICYLFVSVSFGNLMCKDLYLHFDELMNEPGAAEKKFKVLSTSRDIGDKPSTD